MFPRPLMSNRPSRARCAAVIGGGTMGTGIAAMFAARRWNAVVVEPDRGRWRDARRRIARAVAQLQPRARPGIVTIVPALAEVPWRAVDIVVECAPENLALKRRLFAELERRAPARIPLASNSSSFPISGIGKGLKTQRRMLGLHFFMPAHLVPAVEVVRSRKTTPRVAARCARWMVELGKIPVEVKRDVPGFLANRLQHALMREALDLIDRGLATPRDVDNAVRYGFGLRFLGAGPVMQRDLAGLEIHCAAAATMYPDLSRTGRPSRTLRRLVAAGKLGMKTGEGFYRWTPQTAAAQKARYEGSLIAALKLLGREKS